MTAAQDQQATRDARALRARGYEPLIYGPPDSPGGGLLSEGGPYFTTASVFALLDVYERKDLLTRARTRITRGEPDEVLWVPRWVAVLAWLRSYAPEPGDATDALRDAERSEEVRAANEAKINELRDACLAAADLGGPEAARRILEARRNG